MKSARKRARDLGLECLLDEIRAVVRETRGYTGRPALDERVMDALRQVPRHAFVPDELQDCAYINDPLPIGCGQTISQPYIVALMTDLIEPRASDVVLEVGTGSGYQSAVLAELVGRVYTLEIVDELAEAARQRLQRLGYDNVEVRCGDGCAGWPEHAPFDAIIVTAGATGIPPALIEQLKPGGTLVIPVGVRYFGQMLTRVDKDEKGRVREKAVLPVAFVPLIGAPAA
ncbi:MAG: protein-L-isoaspartate(D-aspartate) O-methyltransferase [Rhodocyclaceae bacterium]